MSIQAGQVRYFYGETNTLVFYIIKSLELDSDGTLVAVARCWSDEVTTTWSRDLVITDAMATKLAAILYF